MIKHKALISLILVLVLSSLTCLVRADIITLDLSAGWNMVSIPGDPVIDDIPSLVNGLPLLPYAKIYNPLTRTFENVTKFGFGKGYFLGAGADTQLMVEYLPRYTMDSDLLPGWNMIGSLPIDIPMANMVTNSINYILPYAKWWDPINRKYINVDIIETGKGHFLGAGYECTVAMNAPEISNPSVIPEPSTLILLGIGIMGMAGYAKRKRKKA